MPTIYDNIENQFAEGLINTLEVSNRADFCVGYFNLRGWKQVADYIDKMSGGENNQCRLLIGMHIPPHEMLYSYLSQLNDETIDNKKANQIKKELAQHFKEQLTKGIPTEIDEVGLRKLSKQVLEGKVCVKLFLKHPLHAKLYLCFRDDKLSPIIGFVGSSNLTFAGLLKQGELNVDVLEQDSALKLSKWFNERWNDRWCIDISNDLIQTIQTSWAADIPYSPYYIYLKIAYHLSQEARAGISSFKIPKIFKDQLLEFQQKAVLIAAHHLNKREGVLIGDVVGLGKTIIACALARIFEDDFYLETLIICPKNLVRMWEEYKYKYQLRAHILSLSVVQNELPDLRRYRIVIIDESHNLRNREGKRYHAIQEYIKLNASKVILLTATPYNKTYQDLSNQLRLFIDEEKDLGISPERYIESINGIEEFVAKYQYSSRSLLAFEKSDYADDWRELMRLYLVRRTRSFIKLNYSLIDESNNRKYLLFSDGRRSYFPDRRPLKIEYRFDIQDVNDQYAKFYSDEVVKIISELTLPRYGLGNYINEKLPIKPTVDEETVISNLSRAGKRLIGFARTNLFKRLESSGYSFLLSISRHILRNYIFIYAIEKNLPIPIGTQELFFLDDFLDEKDLETQDEGEKKYEFSFDQKYYFTLASEMYRSFKEFYQNKFDWIRPELFVKNLIEELKSDSIKLLKIIEKGNVWEPQKDKQLLALSDLCNLQYPNDKIIIFTQYSDTAHYIFDELKKLEVANIECVTGDSDDPTEMAYRFSPRSNEQKNYINSEKEIRVLVSTDVLSEGQNLQDCHIVVNYDLPWAIIRLIQRTGRVDRIGQQADEILCYSFLPEDGLEQIIRLRSRLRQRINENAEVVGSDEIFFEGDPINIADLYNEKAGILDEDEDGEIDLSSYAYQIWKNACDMDQALQKIIPELSNVIYSTKANETKLPEGVIVYTRTYDDNDILIYIDKSGNIVTQSQLKILKLAECNPNTKPLTKLENHHKLVEKSVAYIKQNEKAFGGQLGKKSSARYRVYHRLSSFYEENKDTLFVNDEIKKAIEDIYHYPLKEFAKEILNRQLKAGIDDQDLANLVASLREEDKLCIINEEEIKYREPQIICSLGLKNYDK